MIKYNCGHTKNIDSPHADYLATMQCPKCRRGYPDTEKDTVLNSEAQAIEEKNKEILKEIQETVKKKPGRPKKA